MTPSNSITALEANRMAPSQLIVPILMAAALFGKTRITTI